MTTSPRASSWMPHARPRTSCSSTPSSGSLNRGISDYGGSPNFTPGEHCEEHTTYFKQVFGEQALMKPLTV
uniref:Uncharacterized protein n=1 Tax=Anguilla anguilla TaxID=7936 RepID=A0A0E9PPC0_ANGAN